MGKRRGPRPDFWECWHVEVGDQAVMGWGCGVREAGGHVCEGLEVAMERRGSCMSVPRDVRGEAGVMYVRAAGWPWSTV